MVVIDCSFFLDEIIMHEGVTAVYRSNVDLFFCVLGAQNENEVGDTVGSTVEMLTFYDVMYS